MELKKCPFCGNTNAPFLGTSDEIDGDNIFDYFAVCCGFNKGGCGATGGFRETREEAAAAWNKRVTDGTIHGEVGE